jgi:histidine triad (HIT) family protein
MSCLFCRIGAGEIPAAKVYEDAELFVIRDINPVAPTHVLIIPRKHVETLLDLTESDHALVGRVHALAAKLAREEGFADAGYRVVANCNRDGGQSVFHIHFHLLAGRPMTWPPG